MLNAIKAKRKRHKKKNYAALNVLVHILMILKKEFMKHLSKKMPRI